MFAEKVKAFREWLAENGAYIHPHVQFVEDASGMSPYAIREIPPDTKVVSCPFSLAVTPELSKCALLKIPNCLRKDLDALSERELICTYLVLHWIIDETQDNDVLTSATDFIYLPYLHVLPSPDTLRTPLHFNEKELNLLKGTNLYGATLDRRTEWQSEWKRCQHFISSIKSIWESLFTWNRYLTASTYLSSRAFPSTILSRTPSLISTLSSHPVLLPGVDSLNHSRAQRVSWVIDDVVSKGRSLVAAAPETSLQVSLVIHARTPPNAEVCNNYGLKPNSELILGYGFSLPSNPDDTIVLKIGGHDGTGAQWEVGHNARGAEGLWQELRNILDGGSDQRVAEWETDLDAAEILKDMILSKLSDLPNLPGTPPPTGVRDEVLEMFQDYVLGQRDILESLSEFADAKRASALINAKEDGVELFFEEDCINTMNFQFST